MTMRRRDFMRMASAGLSLPWLSNFAQGQDIGGTSPKRVLIVIDQLGRFGERTSSTETEDAPWVASENSDYVLTPANLGWMLKPLENQIENLSVMSGTVMSSRQVLGGGASHAQVNSYALTGSRVSGNIRSTDTVCAHPSINTFIGDELNAIAASKSVYNSLPIGGIAQMNYTSAGLRTSAFGSPASIYETAFGVSGNSTGGGDTSGLDAQRTVLEQVRSQLAQIAPELVQANATTVMDAYNFSLDQIANELEVRASGGCEDVVPDNPLNTDEGIAGVEQTFDAMYDLFACGLTPSIAYCYNGGNPAALRDDALTGADAGAALTNGNYHRISHRNDEPTGAAQGLIMRFQISEIARLANRLAVTPELDGSGDMMMDNTVVFYTQSMSQNTHGTTTPYYRFFLAGRNTNIQRGMHFDCSSNSDNELFTTLAQGVGLPVTQFGGYSGDNYQGESLNTGPISKALIETLGGA